MVGIFKAKLTAADIKAKAKALGADLTKAIGSAESATIDSWVPPADLSINFTPDDMMRLMQANAKMFDKFGA